MGMWTRKKKITISVLLAIVVILIGGYLFGTHRVATTVPGHVYQYTSVNGNHKLYMAFSKNTDQVVVTANRAQAIKANSSDHNFQDVYDQESKNGTWQYLAKGSHLTLSKTQSGKNSRWQYNRVLVLGKKMYAGSFTYQIANAGQGVDRKNTTFERVR
ncbi:hypothetical protein [uncultured Limosilactobacillus sp.]|uniref:hypothetical protein n=1 Tax=uncultured Limosilactobacillus sp. TaxID=2837629 RepID=UPI0025E27803|nr:hypothetical protein [uncultured Limosilactobacillus sp.]